MKLEIIPVYEHLDDYIAALGRKNADAPTLWAQYAVAPYWGKLSEYAPFDISDRQPKPVGDIAVIKKQVGLLRQLNLVQLKSEFDTIAAVLADDDEEMTVALYPIDDGWVRKAQNGVLGTCTWGHVVIMLDPTADNYEAWIPYVFGHEYYHNIWGRYWYHLHRGELEYMFVNDLLGDGLADTFALSFYPELKPKWLFDMSEETEKRLWKAHYSLLIEETAVDYNKYMFGDERDNIPWCAGYAIGLRIVQQYIKTHPHASMPDLLKMRPIDIYKESGYGGLMS